MAGIGQGISFSRGLADIVELAPADRRAEVSSTYFVVAYVALSLPVVGEGLAAQHWGLRTAGVSFAIAIAVLSAICLAAIVVQERRRSPPGVAREAPCERLAALAPELAAALQRPVCPRLLLAAVLVGGPAARVGLLALERLAELALVLVFGFLGHDGQD